MSMRYKVVSEVRQAGDWVDIPDSASNVNVQPVDVNGTVRVTYLEPVKDVALDSETKSETYID
jgi:hypothetical protein